MGQVTSGRTFSLRGTPAATSPGALPSLPASASPPSRGAPAPRAPKKTLVDFIPGGDQLDVATKEKLVVSTRRLTTGAASRTPMMCKGLQCPFIGYCELNRAKVTLPLDQECPIELYVVDQWKEDFLEGIEADKQENSVYIRQLVDQMGQNIAIAQRVLMKAGLEPDPIQRTSMGVNFKGDPIEMKQLFPGYDLLLRIQDRNVRILRELLGTPRAKAEAGRLGFNDPSSKTAGAQAAAAEALKELGSLAPMPGSTGRARLGEFMGK